MKTRGNTLIEISDNDIKDNTFIVPENIYIINPTVFKNRLSLNKILFHNNVKEIRRNSLSNTGIKNLYIPEGVEIIGDYAFYKCSDLEEVILPRTLKEIGNYAFASTNIKSIIIPEQIKIIRNSTFHNCKCFTDITLSKNLEVIEEYAFAYSAIKNINNINDNIYIDDRAFQGTDYKLKKVYK